MQIDRMTVNWQGIEELAEAKEFRSVAGKGGINKLIKQLIRDYMQSLKQQAMV